MLEKESYVHYVTLIPLLKKLFDCLIYVYIQVHIK